MNEEIDIYADVDKVHSHQPNYENGFAEMKMVSIYIGNLTWWTSDYDLEQQIKKNGIADLVEIKIYENASNGQSKGYALVHLGSESSAKLLMDKFPKIDLNGQKPIVTPANASTHQQFESVVSRRRKLPEQTQKEANQSPNQQMPHSQAPPQMPHLGHMPPLMPTQPGLMHPPINGPPPVIPPPGVRPSFPPPPPFHHQPPRPPMPLPPPGFMPPSFLPQFPPQLPIDPMDEEAMDKNKQISSSAIKRAVDDASNGNYASAIETLLNAISSIKTSKVAKDERARVMISSLQDCLHGIEEKSFGANSTNSSSSNRERESSRSSRSDSDRKSKRDRRDRSRSRDRSRDRDSKRSRNRSRSRERRRSDYDDRDRR